VLPFELDTHCQRVSALNAVGGGTEFSVVQWCLAVVKEPLPSSCPTISPSGHTWYGRCCGRWLRKRLTACRFIHTFHRCRSETPSAACRFSGNHNN